MNSTVFESLNERYDIEIMEHAMPRYFFNVTYGSLYVADKEGEHLANSADAVLHATAICKELTRNNPVPLDMSVIDDADVEITHISTGRYDVVEEPR